MTIVEALTASRQNGQSYARESGHFTGWIRWDDEHLYHDLSAEDLVADDWVPDYVVVEKMTGGRWTTPAGTRARAADDSRARRDGWRQW